MSNIRVINRPPGTVLKVPQWVLRFVDPKTNYVYKIPTEPNIIHTWINIHCDFKKMYPDFPYGIPDLPHLGIKLILEGSEELYNDF